jgi:putative cell wall-binding protein
LTYLTRKTAKILVAVLLTVCLIIPLSPAPAQAGQNPPLEEISKLFDRVAMEKKVPAEILKAIAYHESHWQQFYANGEPVGGYYIGIMQVSTPRDPAVAERLRNDIAFNIAYGADMLKAKWDATPRIGDGDPAKIENWYFAIWAYHRWDSYNNPHVAAACGRTPFQDKIYQIMNREYIKGITNPVSVTPIPKSQIPKSGVPSAKTSWQTPQPVHYAAFSMGMPVLSRSQENNLLSAVPRIYGCDRIDTALKIADEGWPHGCQTVVIANAQDYSDALAGVSLARKNKAPLLLNPQEKLDARVKASLLDLKPLKVVIMGGENAISTQAEQDIRETVYWTQDFERIVGNDKYETAALAASQFPEGCGVAIVNADDIPDAVSLASAAAAKGYPLLLTDRNSLPSATADALRQICPTTVYLAGGKQVISEELVEQIAEATGLSADQIRRLDGKNRYETAACVLDTFHPEFCKMYVVNGTAYPDALAGAVLAAYQNTLLLLIPPQGPTVGSHTEKYLECLAAKAKDEIELKVIGSQEAISDRCILKMKHLLAKK